MYKTDGWNNSMTPVVIWLNGGPGFSSQIGNFISNGVLQITQSPLTNDTANVDQYNYTVTNKASSWADNATMVYVDQPAGAGFSFSSNNISDTMPSLVAADFMQFMYNLYYMYPEFVGRPLFLGGEGEAAQFIAVFANQLVLI